MNQGQMAMQLKHLLQQVRWPLGSADLVFGTMGRVAVFAGTPTEEQLPQGFPFCFVKMDGGEVDPDEPGIILARFGILVGAEVAGDRMGEQAITGGPAGDMGKSAGRGAAELSERARRAVQSLTGFDGARIQVSSVQTVPPTAIGRGRHLVMEETTLEAVCTSAPHYAAPQQLRHEVGTGSAGPKWVWFGEHCESRFDFMRYRLLRKAGEDPSKTPADGTVIYTGTVASFSGTRVNGQTYTVFADYNSRGASTVEGSSGPEVGAYRVS